MIIGDVMKYILITTAKNEEKKLPLLANSIIKQTALPQLWFILNDGSTDKTKKVIDGLKLEHNWIYSADLDESTAADLGLHFSKLLQIASNCVVKLSCEKNINYNFLGKVDADIILPHNLFELLILKMNQDTEIGIAGPKLDIITEDNNVVKTIENIEKKDVVLEEDDSILDDPSDAVRLFRKECMDDIGGFQFTYAPDMVICAKSKISGWKTKRYKDITAYHCGKTSDTDGLWNGLKFNGFENYYLNISFYVVLMHTIRLLLKYKHYSSFAFLYGYLISYFEKKERIEDPALVHYFGKEYPRYIKRAIIRKIG